MSGYNYITFVEYEKMALAAGAGFRNLGLQKDDKIHLYGATRYVSSIKAQEADTDRN